MHGGVTSRRPRLAYDSRNDDRRAARTLRTAEAFSPRMTR